MNFIENIDFAILYWIQENIRCAFFDGIFPIITSLCEGGIIWILFGVALLFFKKYRKYGFFLLIAMLLGSVIGNDIIKPLVARPRPCHIASVLPDMLIDIPTSFSFPSGHTASSVVSATVLVCANKKFGYAAIPLAVLIAFSRMYLFVHFPTDILAGAILGVSLAFATIYVGNKLIEKFILHRKKGSNEN